MHPEYNPEFIEKFWKRVDKDGPIPPHAPDLGPCWLWTGHIAPKGYGVVNHKGVGDVPDVGNRAHRVAFYLAFGWITPGGNGWDIAHTCDARNCVRPTHLMCISHLDNVADRNAKGRQDHGPNAPRFQPPPKTGVRRGEGASRAKLTEDQVREIRALYRPGVHGFGYGSLAKRYGVHDFAIEMIVKRKSWKHVD